MVLGRKKLFFYLCILLVAGNVIFQIVVHQNGLDNQTVNEYSPARDARDYVQRAALVAEQNDFETAFEDGWRLPGYPLFLSLFFAFSDTPLLVARYAQILLTSLIILILYFTLVNLLKNKRRAFLGALAVSVWIPFYYFSTILKAESLSIFLFALLYLALSALSEKKTRLVLYSSPVILALLVYLKPNHVFISLPLLAFLYLKNREAVSLFHLAGVFVLFALLLAPWTAYVSLRNDRLIPLSTTAGRNLYLGTGVAMDQHYEKGALHFLTADRFELRSQAITDQTLAAVQSLSKSGQSDYYTEVAKQIWMSRPVETTTYGLAKILHGFGFSLRDVRDVVFASFFLSSIAFSVFLWTSNRHREWCVMFWGVVFVTSLQTFFFTIEQRYKVVVFDIPAMLIIITGFFHLVDRVLHKRFGQQEAIPGSGSTSPSVGG